MTQPATNPYLKTKILTASPEELRLLLYDGAIKFCQQAIKPLEDKQYETSYNCLMRAQKIVLELSTSLNHDAAPQLCERLSALYIYIYRLLVDANMRHTAEPVHEALRLLEYERETWQMLMHRAAEDGDPPANAAEHAKNIQGAQQTAISSFSQKA